MKPKCRSASEASVVRERMTPPHTMGMIQAAANSIIRNILSFMAYGFSVKSHFLKIPATQLNGFLRQWRIMYLGSNMLCFIAQNEMQQVKSSLCLVDCSFGIVLFLVDDDPGETTDRICSAC